MLKTEESASQMITGTWKGQINKKKVELKIIQKGDSLFGTSYYYESINTYRRYSIKGYFDGRTNETIWWDDQLIDEKKGKLALGSPGKVPYLSNADFNCPGSGKMILEGKASLINDRDNIKGAVDLVKTGNSIFKDEWDFIIDNYTEGANDPTIIDSVAAIASSPAPVPVNEIMITKPTEMQKRDDPVFNVRKRELSTADPFKPAPSMLPVPIPETIQTIEEKFVKREKIFAVEIPVIGDSIELRFYDNAEIDGDSISLFLNNRMIFQHIFLKASPYIIKIAVSELNETNELVMVAENLGSIPPNTSYMLAIVNNIRYEAMLKSTEETSASIRLVKK
ncbi:MAG TPA: hypothetical protein VI548_10300 [Chitinophagaceae bacterium]|nr:hypothetical protein [Chitinophagaceae bacterium]